MIRRALRAVGTLRGVLFVALALVGVLPLAVVGFAGATLSREALARESAQDLIGMARGLAGELETYRSFLMRNAAAIAALPELVSMDPVRLTPLLEEQAHRHSEFTRLTIFDRNGRAVASSAPLPPISIAERPWFQRALARGEQTWGVAHAQSDGSLILAINTPIRAAEGRIVGVLGTPVRFALLATGLRGRALANEHAFVLDADGQVLLHADAAQIGMRADEVWQRLLAAGDLAAPGVIAYSRGGERYSAGYVPIPETGWTVVVERFEAEVLAPAEHLWQLSLTGLGGAILLAVAAAALLARVLSAPVCQLVAATRAFAAGDLNAPLPRLGPDDGELGTLVATFAAMRADVAARAAALERLHAASALLHRTADLDATLDALVAHAVALTGATHGALARPEGERLVVRHAFGLPAASEPGGLVTSEGGPSATVYRSGRPLRVNDPNDPLLRELAPDGHVLTSFLGVPLLSHGRVLGVLSVCNSRVDGFSAEDERLLATLAGEVAIVLENAELMRRAAQAAALEELSRQQRLIINTIAHELRTPLSYLVGYSELLLHRQPSPELLREGLSAIYRGALQLRDVVTDIVELAQHQTGRLALDWQDVDLGRLVPSWVAELASPPRVVVRVGPEVPLVRGDVQRLRHVVGHLVRNALKFSPADTTVEVEVERAGPEEVALRVRDRGPGIAPEDIERVFDLFWRAAQAQADAVPGSGLGLALVKRLVELHQGRVVVESTIGQGSTFTVVLPIAAALPARVEPSS